MESGITLCGDLLSIRNDLDFLRRFIDSLRMGEGVFDGIFHEKLHLGL